MKKNFGKLLVIALVAALAVGFYAFDLSQYLSLGYLKTQQSYFQQAYATHPAPVIAAYLVLYVATAALSLPGATILTVAGGAMFGLLIGTILVSLASTVGATCAFLIARYLVGGWVHQKLGDRLSAVNAGIEREGAFYLFALRVIPVFPFFVVNIAMALTKIRASQFFVVSQIGMLPASIVYVNVGTQLAKVESLKGILSPELLLSFAALGAFPLVAKKVLGLFRQD